MSLVHGPSFQSQPVAQELSHFGKTIQVTHLLFGASRNVMGFVVVVRVTAICLVAMMIAAVGVAQATGFATAERHVRELEQVSGTPLEVGKNLSQDIVYISPSIVDSETQKQVLARMLQAEWVQDGPRQRLIRKREVEKGLAEAELKARVDQLRFELESILKASEVFPNIDANQADAMAAMLQNTAVQFKTNPNGANGTEGVALLPASRAIAKLLLAQDLRQIAAMKAGSRIAMAGDPTTRQLPIRGDWLGIIQELTRETQLFEAAILQHSGESPFKMFGLAWPRFLDRVPDRFHLVIRSYGDGGIAPRIIVGSPGGLGVLDSTLQMPLMQLHGQLTTPLADQIPAATLIKLEPQTRDVLRSWRTISPRPQLRPLPDAVYFPDPEPAPDPAVPDQTNAVVREAILNPDKFEPLELAMTPILESLERVWGKPVVAEIPDQIVVDMATWIGDRATVDARELTQFLEKHPQIRMADREDVREIRPVQPSQVREDRVSRRLISKIMRPLASQTFLSLDQNADFALQFPHHAAYLGGGALDATLRLGYDYGLCAKHTFESPGWELLRLWGVLTPPQRKLVIDDQLRAPAFQGFAQSIADEYLYYNAPGPSLGGWYSVGTYGLERTYFQSEGWDRGTQIWATTRTEPLLLMRDSGRIRMMTVEGVVDQAERLYNKNHTYMLTSIPVTKNAQFVQIPFRDILTRADFNLGCSMEGRLLDFVPQNHPRFVPFNQLPNEILELAEKYRQRPELPRIGTGEGSPL